jgi:hypothetical protein
MDIMLAKVGGDVDEFRRVSRFARMMIDPDVYVYANQIPVSAIIGTTDEDDPVFDYPWHKAKTRDKRRKYLDLYAEKPSRSHGFGMSVFFPVEYCVALYEDELKDIYELAAIIIQKHIRGILIRNMYGVHNPYCEIGRRFILKMFENT